MKKYCLPPAIISNGLHRTSSDIINFSHYFDEELTLLVPSSFYDQDRSKNFESESFKIKPLVQQQPLLDFSAAIDGLDFTHSCAKGFEKEIKDLLIERTPVAISLIDSLEIAKQNYTILFFITTNEAFIHERVIMDWCKVNNIPVLHTNHGLTLNTQYGAYHQLAADYLSIACPNEVDFILETLNYEEGPSIHINGLPSWDKYALINNPTSKAYFISKNSLPEDHLIVTYFPTIKNTTYVSKNKDPHLIGIEKFISAISSLCNSDKKFFFFIKDRPGNEKFVQEKVYELLRKYNIPDNKLKYVFDHAEPYVAFSDLTIATKSTISAESVLCRTPHINLIRTLWQAVAFDYDCNILHLHISELAEFLGQASENPVLLEEIAEKQSKTDLLVGPGQDYCSSLRVARLMAEVVGRDDIYNKINHDIGTWHKFIESHSHLPFDELINHPKNPIPFHWKTVSDFLLLDHRFEQPDFYHLWLQRKSPEEVDGQLMAERLQKSWSHQPSFHLFFIVDKTLFEHLADSLSALDSQIYKLYGVTVISTDSCPEPSLLTLENFQWVVSDQPFKQVNAVVEAVESDWVLPLYPGDELLPDALYNFADFANLNRDWMALYGDEDDKFTDRDGNEKRRNPYFKPDFNLELLRSSNYTGHQVAFRRDAFMALGGFTDLPYVQTEDLLFKLAERMTVPAIGHLPFITSHRSAALSTALDSEEVENCAIKVRQEHLARCGFEHASVQVGLKPRTYQLCYSLNPLPKIAVIMPVNKWHDFALHAINSLLEVTQYKNYQLIIACTEDAYNALSEDVKNSDQCEMIQVATNATKAETINTLISSTKEHFDAFCLVESDTHFVQNNWLDRLVEHLAKPNTGMVAPRLVSPQSRVVSAGQILGMNGDVDDLFKDFHLEQDLNNQPRAWCDQNFSALNPSCVLISKEALEQVGGLCPNFAEYFYLADCGLKMQLKGWRLHWTPYSTVASQTLIYHHTQADRLSERQDFLDQWFDLLVNDPAFNINLLLRDSGHQADYRSAASWHPVFKQQLRVLLVPLFFTPEADDLIATLGFYLEQLNSQEKIRFSSYVIQAFFEEDEQPHLFEIARTQPDIVIFIGEERGKRQGLVMEVKKYLDCPVCLYTRTLPLPGYWDGQETLFDLIMTLENCEAGWILPKPKEATEQRKIDQTAQALFAKLLSILKSEKKIKAFQGHVDK